MFINILTSFFTGFLNLALLPWRLFQWLQLETLKEKMNVVILMGNSSQFLCMVIALMTIIIIIGLIRHDFLVRTVERLQNFSGGIGKFACWAALIMMMQQVLIIAIGQIFRGNEITLAPIGLQLINEELQWLSGQLKLYNAILIAMASAYTFIEGGHVRVDLIYSHVSYRSRKIIDLVGTLIFLFPTSFLLWWFAWPLATNSMFSQRPMNIWSTKASWRSFKWESSGTAEFTWVWAFKLLIVVFAGLMLIQAFTFLLRNIRALREKEEIEAHPKFDKTTQQVGDGSDHSSVHAA